MKINRFTWVAFAFVGLVTALWPTRVKLEVLLYTVYALAVIDLVVGISKVEEQRSATILRVLCNLLAVCACIRTLHWNTAESNLVARFDSVTLALVVLCRVFGCLYALSRAVASNAFRHTVVRTITYILIMLVVQLLAAIHVQELSKLLNGTHATANATITYSSLYETTRADCIASNSNSTEKGFIFSESPFTPTCPTRLWKHIRNNILFASQVYVLYTITTDIAIRSQGTHAVLRIVLAAIECTALSAAAALQFDVIAGCEALDLSVAVPLFVALVAYLVRLTPDEYINAISKLSSSDANDNHLAVPALRPLRLKDVKLKL